MEISKLECVYPVQWYKRNQPCISLVSSTPIVTDNPNEFKLSGIINEIVSETGDLADNEVDDYVDKKVYVSSQNSGIQSTLMSHSKRIKKHVKKVHKDN